MADVAPAAEAADAPGDVADLLLDEAAAAGPLCGAVAAGLLRAAARFLYFVFPLGGLVERLPQLMSLLCWRCRQFSWFICSLAGAGVSSGES